MVLSVGGFPLADYRAGLSDLFTEDEIAVYESDAELLEKARYYLVREDARLKMAEKGRRRVLKDHTYEERVKVIVRETKRHFNLS
jgi:spore maturation protein CgeB